MLQPQLSKGRSLQLSILRRVGAGFDRVVWLPAHGSL
jgi:hypothetical protein